MIIISEERVMDSKLLEIFAITVPVFAIAGVGKLLDSKGVLTSENKKPLSWITYYIALPALIFSSFLKKGETPLPVGALVTMSLVGIVLSSLFVLMFLFPKRNSLEPKKWYATIFTSFWGNNGYMGIPLAISALGETAGLPLAAVINGVSVPFYIGISLVMMVRAQGSEEKSDNVMGEFLHTLFNPVILAMIFGALLSAIRPYVPMVVMGNEIIKTLFHTVLATFTHLGHMGLPLALLLVGSNLKLDEVKSDKSLLVLTVFTKLMVAPAAVFFITPLIFPSIPKESFQALVLLNAVPGAVASFIISEKFSCAEDFVSSSLVISTLFSIVTIPFWLSVIL